MGEVRESDLDALLAETDSVLDSVLEEAACTAS
jgi:hypothetical protein